MVTCDQGGGEPDVAAVCGRGAPGEGEVVQLHGPPAVRHGAAVLALAGARHHGRDARHLAPAAHQARVAVLQEAAARLQQERVEVAVVLGHDPDCNNSSSGGV